MSQVHFRCAQEVFGSTSEDAEASKGGQCEWCKDLIDPGAPFVDISAVRIADKKRQLDPQEVAKALVPHMAEALRNLAPKMLADMLGKKLTTQVNKEIENSATKLESRTADFIKEIKEASALLVSSRPLEIKISDMPMINVGQQHYRFPLLLKALLAGTNVWLAGPSGSGKTTAAVNAARAMGTSFRYTGAVGDPYGLMGYKSATGEYIRTPFREAWEHGGVFLWDEIDASDANALLAFNAALANGSCAFPDAIVPKHPGCLIIAAANTWGHGATNDYVGRNKIDGAFLKRFAFISWDYDENLEMATCSNKEWCAKVQEVRKKVKASKLRVLVTPRETYTGERLLAAGCTQEEAEEMTLRAGMTDEQWAKCKPLPAIPVPKSSIGVALSQGGNDIWTNKLFGS